MRFETLEASFTSFTPIFSDVGRKFLAVLDL